MCFHISFHVLKFAHISVDVFMHVNVWFRFQRTGWGQAARWRCRRFWWSREGTGWCCGARPAVHPRPQFPGSTKASASSRSVVFFLFIVMVKYVYQRVSMDDLRPVHTKRVGVKIRTLFKGLSQINLAPYDFRTRICRRISRPCGALPNFISTASMVT